MLFSRFYVTLAKIKVQNTEITIVSHNDDDYISLTDMARSQLQEHIIFRWLSLKSTIEYLGEWEMLYNPNFNCTEFGTFRNMAGPYVPPMMAADFAYRRKMFCL